MKKLHFDPNRLLAKKPEEPKAPLPLKQELNEQELATVTGGGGGYEHNYYHHRYHRYHHYHHEHDEW